MSDQNEEILTLIREIKLLREENDRLKPKAKMFFKYMEHMKKQNRLIHYISNSHNENLSSQAQTLVDKYWELVNEFRDLQGKDPIVPRNKRNNTNISEEDE